MIKTIFKELFIGIGACIIIALLMGIMFYSYIPSSETVPMVSKYERSAELEEELSLPTVANDTKTLITYDIGKPELNGYIKTSKLVRGKPNPFGIAPVGDVNENNSVNNTDNTTNNNSTSNGDSYSEDPNAK